MGRLRLLADIERLAWMRLARTAGLGPLTFQRLTARHGGAAGALEALGRYDRLTPPPAAEIEAELAGLARLGARAVALCEPDYPAHLRALAAPPPILALRGKADLAQGPVVAIVGAREASAAGLTLAGRIAAELGAAGVRVASGLARGIDAAAHAASLPSGTIAVLAGGLDKPYPPQNAALHDAIAAQGLIISEARLGLQARARDFPRRNHIVSGVSLGVLVVEAAWRSGSLITARAGAEQGREVMAVPGHPLDPRCRGTNALLKDGAALIETAEDVLAALSSAPTRVRPPDPPRLFDEIEASPALESRLAQLLSPTPVHLNDLAQQAGAPIAAVAAALTELELAGAAQTLAGGYAVSRV